MREGPAITGSAHRPTVNRKSEERRPMQKNKYQVMPDLSEDEYSDLKADIAKRGVMVPIELDEVGDVLDGHHRLRACEELGITDYPTVTRAGMTEDEKILHAYKLNVARRHLTTEQTMATVAGALRRFPGKSNREIANITGISHPTVGKYRKLLEESGQVEKVATREGADGKSYPSERKATARPQDAAIDHPFLTWQCCICRKPIPVKYHPNSGEFTERGMNNAWPLSYGGHCCDHCDKTLVIPARAALLLTLDKDGKKAMRKMEMQFLATDALTTYTTDVDGAPDYELPRALAAIDIIDGKFDAVMQGEGAKPELLAYKIVSIAERANTLGVWEAARNALNDLHGQYTELVELAEAKETALLGE